MELKNFAIFGGVIVLALVMSNTAQAQTATDPPERFNVFLKIAPVEGAAPVAHDGVLSWRYQVELTVSGTGETETKTMPAVFLLVGEKKTKSALFGADRIAYEVSIDPTGEKASAIVEVSTNGVPTFVQRFAVWLPPPPEE